MNNHPSLLFGNKRSLDFNSAYDLKLFYSDNVQGVSALEARSSEGMFLNRAAAQNIGSISAVATAISPINISWKANQKDKWTILLPYAGGGSLRIKNENLIFGDKTIVLFCPSENELQAIRDRGLSIFLNIDAKKIWRIVQTSERHEKESFFSEKILQTRVIDTYSPSCDYLSIIANLVKIIDLCDGDENYLTGIGLDDILQRHILNMLYIGNDNNRDDTSVKLSNRSDRSVDILCDAIRQFTAGKVMTITEMQKITGLSGRSLQLAFNRRFGCTPREWQRNEHLGKARELLIDSNNNQSVKDIAYRLGFSSALSFSRFYNERFGELPSVTLRKKK